MTISPPQVWGHRQYRVTATLCSSSHIGRCEGVLSSSVVSSRKETRDDDTLGIPSSWGGIVELPREKGELGEGRGNRGIVLVEGCSGFF